MNLKFELSQSITLLDLYVRDTTQYASDVIISKYRIEYKTYIPGLTTYYYEAATSIKIDNILSGEYIPISEFTDVNDELVHPTSIEDDAYEITIVVTYDDSSGTDLTLETEIIKCFYQGIYNTYSQLHLTYDWTSRYKESTKELLQIAEELTWMDSLKLSSENTQKPEEFLEILESLQKYFTLEYDY